MIFFAFPAMQPIGNTLTGSAALREEKAALRRRAHAARNAQPDKERLSRRICAGLQQLPACRQATTVLWYVHCRSEVRTMRALQEALETRGKCIAVPYCTKDGQGQRRLGLWRLEQLGELISGTWGIPEPPRERWQEPGRVIEPQQLDLGVVPGVAFDRNGGRLGNGAGYYDRLLREVRADTVLVGVCYASQLFPEIPMQEHNVVMDYVVTEQAVYSGIGRT